MQADRDARGDSDEFREHSRGMEEGGEERS